jgi:hypothetical protein
MSGSASSRQTVFRRCSARRPGLVGLSAGDGTEGSDRQPRRKSAHDPEMLHVAERHKVQAITERFAMSKANDAVTKVKKNQVRYRAVLAKKTFQGPLNRRSLHCAALRSG